MMKFMFVDIFIHFEYIYLFQTQNLRNGPRKTLSVLFKNVIIGALNDVHPLKAGAVMCFFVYNTGC